MHLLFIKIAAAVAVSADEVIPPVALFALLHQLAVPAEIKAAVRKAALFIENVVHRHAALEPLVSLVHALENVHGFVEVFHNS